MNQKALDYAKQCTFLEECKKCKGTGIIAEGVFMPEPVPPNVFSVGVASVQCFDCGGSGHSKICKIAVGNYGEIQCPEEPPKMICCAFCDFLERCCDKCPEIPLW